MASYLAAGSPLRIYKEFTIARPTPKRVFPKVIEAAAKRRSLSWIMAMWTHASVVSHRAS